MTTHRHISLVVAALAAVATITWLTGWWGGGDATPTIDEQGATDMVPADAPDPADPVTTAGAKTGESRTEAQAPVPFAIHGVVTRNGAPVAGREVRCAGARTEYLRSITTSSDGAFRFEVARGKFTLELPFTTGTTFHQLAYTRWPADGPSLLRSAWRRVEVVDRDVRTDFELPTGAIAARALDAIDSHAIARAEFVWRPPPPAMEELRQQGNAGGAARFMDVGTGTHLLIARSRGYREAAIEIEVGEGQKTVDLHLEPTGALDVRLVDERGQALEISAAQTIHPLNILTGGSPEKPTNEADLRRKPRPRVLEYDDLLPGDYWVVVPRDDEYEEPNRSVRYQPTETEGIGEVKVVAGQVARVEIPVQYRCYAELSAVDQQGNRADVDLRIERLDSPGGVARVLPALWFRDTGSGAHFEGYLAPGTYAVTMKDGEESYRHTLTVGREPINRSFALPW